MSYQDRNLSEPRFDPTRRLYYHIDLRNGDYVYENGQRMEGARSRDSVETLRSPALQTKQSDKYSSSDSTDRHLYHGDRSYRSSSANEPEPNIGSQHYTSTASSHRYESSTQASGVYGPPARGKLGPDQPERDRRDSTAAAMSIDRASSRYIADRGDAQLRAAKNSSRRQQDLSSAARALPGYLEELNISGNSVVSSSEATPALFRPDVPFQPEFRLPDSGKGIMERRESATEAAPPGGIQAVAAQFRDQGYSAEVAVRMALAGQQPSFGEQQQQQLNPKGISVLDGHHDSRNGELRMAVVDRREESNRGARPTERVARTAVNERVLNPKRPDDRPSSFSTQASMSQQGDDLSEWILDPENNLWYYIDLRTGTYVYQNGQRVRAGSFSVLTTPRGTVIRTTFDSETGQKSSIESGPPALVTSEEMRAKGFFVSTRLLVTGYEVPGDGQEPSKQQSSGHGSGTSREQQGKDGDGSDKPRKPGGDKTSSEPTKGSKPTKKRSTSTKYRVSDRPEEDYAPRTVIELRWTALPTGTDANTRINTLSERTRLRRFVVMETGQDSSIVLPINTNNGLGVAVSGVRRSHHCVIYTGRDVPTVPSDEGPIWTSDGLLDTMRPNAIRVKPMDPETRLDRRSRLNLGEPIEIVHARCEIAMFGEVVEQSWPHLALQFQAVQAEISRSRLSRSAPVQPSRPSAPDARRERSDSHQQSGPSASASPPSRRGMERRKK